MKLQTIILSIILFFLLLCPLVSWGSTTGAIWGTTTDSLTGKVIVGAVVRVENLPRQSMSDKNGEYAINQLPPGDYNLKINMIGYIPVAVSDVKVAIDVRRKLNIAMSPDIAESSDKTVFSGKAIAAPYSELAKANLFYSAIQIREILPLNNINEIVTLHSSSLGAHIRGSRERGTIFLVDGHPANDLFYRRSNLNLPVCAVTDATIYNGGFDAEYGQSMSGIANLVTTEGRDNTEAYFILGFDNLAGLSRNNNLNFVEWNWNGPLVIGFGGPLITLNYMIAGKISLNDGPWRSDMLKAFQSPLNKSYSFMGKFVFGITPHIRMQYQALVSHEKWREYSWLWKYSLDGLPEYQGNHSRHNILFHHEINPKLHYSFRFQHYSIDSFVDGVKADTFSTITHSSPSIFDMVTDGKMQWWEKLAQTGNIFKADIVNYPTALTKLKFGLEFQHLDIKMDNVRYQEVPVFGNPVSSRYTVDKNDFHQPAYIIASYFQSQLQLEDIQLNAGLRFDAFHANIDTEAQEFPFSPVQTLRLPPQKVQLQARLGPRFGMITQLTKRDFLLFNYGWFFQMPRLAYLYKNLNHTFEGSFPLIGNPDLEHEISILNEISYRRLWSDDFSCTVTAFQKNLSNLVSTKAVYFVNPNYGDSDPFSPLGYARYENKARGTITGLEFSFDVRHKSWLSAQLKYTFQKATGTVSRAEEPYYRMIWGIQESNDEVPFEWDQRHSFYVAANLGQEEKWGLNCWTKIGSPLPNSVFSPADILLFERRRKWQYYLTLKAYFSIHSLYGRLSPYIQINNVFDIKNYIGYDTNSLPANFLLDDPTLYGLERRILIGISYHLR